MDRERPRRYEKDRRRFDLEPLTDIMGELEDYLNSDHSEEHGHAHDAYVAHCLYNLAAKLVDISTTQKVVVDVLKEIVNGMNRDHKRK